MAAATSSGSDQAFAKLPAVAKLGLGLGVVAIIGAVYYFALHMSLNDDIESAERLNVSLQSDMQAAQERNREYGLLREQLASREGLNRANLLALPAEAETASFLQDLNRLAELSGLRIQLVEPRPEEPEAHYVRLPVNLELSGRYHQLARFFHNVSRLDRLISMEDIHLNNPEIEGEEVILAVTVLATTYRRPSEADDETAAVVAP